MGATELTPYAGWMKNQQINNLVKKGILKNVRFIEDSFEQGKIDDVDREYLLKMNKELRMVLREYEDEGEV